MKSKERPKKNTIRREIPYEVMSLELPILKSEIEKFRLKVRNLKESNTRLIEERKNYRDDMKLTKEKIIETENSSQNVVAQTIKLTRSFKSELGTYYNQIKFLDEKNSSKENDKKFSDEKNLPNEIAAFVKDHESNQEIASNTKFDETLIKFPETYESIENLSKEFKKQISNLENTYKGNYQAVKENLDMSLKIDIYKTEEKYIEIKKHLNFKHVQAAKAIQDYFKNIQLDYQNSIHKLKEEKKSLKLTSQANSALINNIQANNSELEKPLRDIKEELLILESKLSNRDKDLETLKELRMKLALVNRRLITKKQKYDELKIKHDEILFERNDLYTGYENSISKIKEIMSHPTIRPDSTIESDIKVRNKEHQLQCILQSMNIQDDSLALIQTEIEIRQEIKENTLSDLKKSLDMSVTAYNEVSKAFEDKLAAVSKS